MKEPTTTTKVQTLDRRNFLRAMGGVSSIALGAAISPAVSTKSLAMNPGPE